MASMNKVLLYGNLTRTPEMRYSPSGTAIATFGLAINRRFRQGDEMKEEVCFVDIVTFGRQAETACEYLLKGKPALVEGRLQFQSWQDKEGNRRSKHQVVAENIQFLGGAGAVREETPEAESAVMDAGSSEDIPF